MQAGSPLALYILILLSYLVALLVAVFPLPQELAVLRPELICLLVLYWVMFAPELVGVTVAFFAGLLQDIVEGTVWGAHAVALALLAYICLASYQRIRNYSEWHQALWIFVFVGTHQVLVNWAQGLAGYQASIAYMLVPTVITALCWPPLVYGMNRLRRYYRLF
jgi:rod shape-determining protein MreD